MQVLLGWFLWVYGSVSLAIILAALTSKGPADGDGTMWTVGSFQSAIIWLSVISLELILYHWCVSGVMAWHNDCFKNIRM